MENGKPVITVQVSIQLPVATVWKYWNTPADITRWNNPSDEWRTCSVDLDLKEGGRFLFRMEAKNGSTGFDFGGKYDKIVTHQLIEYTLDDGRKTSNRFISHNDGTVTLTETFEPEAVTPLGVQRAFCQSVLNNFKKYAEAYAA